MPGKLGVGLEKGEAHLTPPKITAVWPNSPASMAGWKAGDLITAIDGREIHTQAQLRFSIVPRYAGDTLDVTIRRDEEDIETEVTLIGELEPYRHAFLGILPAAADDSEESTGVVVRAVWPDSPAVEAGVLAEDRLTRVGTTEVEDISTALTAVRALHPEESVELTVQREKEELTVSVTPGTLPENILSRADLPPRIAKDNEQAGDTTGHELETLKLPEFSQEAKFLAPVGDSTGSPGLLLWLSNGDSEADQELADDWQSACRRDNLVLLIARPAAESGWSSEDLDYLWRLTRNARSRWDVDTRRIVISGQGKAGQLAFALAFKRRGAFSGAIGIDAPLPRTLSIPENRPGGRLATLAVESRNSTFAPLVRRDLQELRQAGYPASWTERTAGNNSTDPLDATTRGAIARWMDSLDKF